jgi:uncharacterized protein YutE (UPF0331/DUF86 family)
MADNVLLNKAATIERCTKRAQEEYDKSPVEFDTDFTRQDAAILNIQRACEAAIDAGAHVVRNQRLGLPQSARDVFDLLAQNAIADKELCDTLKKMVGFRNIAVHDYQEVQIPVVIAIIENHLSDLCDFASLLIAISAQKD